MLRKIVNISVVMMLLLFMVGCSNVDEQESSPILDNQSTSTNTTSTFGEDFSTTHIPDITIQFGQGGSPFTMHFEKNDTALAIARNIGETGRNLPIYNYDNFENYEVMQYYDMPNSYHIPALANTVEQQKAGEVYYMAPNRVVLFYQDATIPGEYTKIGTIEEAEKLKSAIENNPVQEGWGNKLILIRFVE